MNSNVSKVTFQESIIVNAAKLNGEERERIQKCRGEHNRLGFCYQLMFVKIFNRFPSQSPLEIQSQILTFASLELEVPIHQIDRYQVRQATLSEHQSQIKDLLNRIDFDQSAIERTRHFVFNEAQKSDQRKILLSKTELFLKENNILFPSITTLERLISAEKKRAKKYIHKRLLKKLNLKHRDALDGLLKSEDSRYSHLHILKQPPAIPSPKALINLVAKINIIEGTGITEIDLSWIKNNYQRILAKYVTQCSSKRIRELTPAHRYTALICFLRQTRVDTIDNIIDMHQKIMLKVYNRAKNQMQEAIHKHRKHFKHSELLLSGIIDILLDDTVQDSDVRASIFENLEKQELQKHALTSKAWLSGKYSHLFRLVIDRFNYLRQFSPVFLKSLEFEGKSERSIDLIKAIQCLNDINQQQKRTLPNNIPLSFIPKKLLPFMQKENTIDRRAYECALLTKVRDEIKLGNLTIMHSKRFSDFDHFFMPYTEWQKERSLFYQRAGLPENPKEASVYLTERLNKAYDVYLLDAENNSYARVENKKWVLSVDPGETRTSVEEEALNQLKYWLGQHMRTIKLPQLLIEVNNDLNFTKEFTMNSLNTSSKTHNICAIIATIMAHGCFIGPYTMARLTESVTYEQIRHITDWQLTEDSQRSALALIVNAITKLDITKQWGEGKTSSGDGQGYTYSRRTLQQTFNTQFRDFALEFYTFIADNYAPYFSLPIECTDRDSPYVLDGILYNESDLVIEEHYTDTHGYTEINFAAFIFLARRFLHESKEYNINAFTVLTFIRTTDMWLLWFLTEIM